MLLVVLGAVSFVAILRTRLRQTVAVEEEKIARPLLRSEEPPTWDWLRRWEQELPQHALDVAAPEGVSGRYLRFNNQAQRLGWNNVLSELLMNAHLAHEAGRGYVFPEFTWEPSHYPWKFYEDEELEREGWPPRTPLNALMSGPVSGGPWEWNDRTPRSISWKHFDIICPPNERVQVNSSTVKKGMEWSEGGDILSRWTSTLKDIPDRCVEILPSDDDGFPQIFDMWLWGSPRVTSLWDSFSKSPVSTLLRPSPLVSAAVARNEYLFLPEGPLPKARTSTEPWGRVLAMHLRRGDYEGACQHFARWSSVFYGWNQLPFLPDTFTPPPGSSWGENTPENTAIYMGRCYPEIDAVVQRVRQAREDSEVYTDVLYLLTNEKGEWLDRLLDALGQDGWPTIRTSRELVLEGVEQKEVAMAVDMDIARRASVFIGNGWSSFTSSIVHRRLVDGKKPESIRFY
ncbi:hypothetical protein CYLTODRAFT_354117 [Cylindrobasidium torrendii FP15055 ss-10]|uniref:Uncharacterized protein n=1 Tax=Cylindrobasidium torrendii FP15055 ss-10 TaxID=1314674 RepID=A0A0D7B904_9AGAR|nr:hypothetical protein CYLTODRAFT_354117 [Cylindrobasidium torrendii FP15055 ss-10]